MMMMMVMVRMVQLVEWKLGGETEVRRENLHAAPLCPPQVPHIVTYLGSSTGRRGGKHVANHLSYGRASLPDISQFSERLRGNRIYNNQELVAFLIELSRRK
jgi:hypothetical protein